MDRVLYSIEETRACLGGISRSSLYAFTAPVFYIEVCCRSGIGVMAG
jgi:hypothetical protein